MKKQKVYTLGDAKKFLNSLTKQQLTEPFSISFDDCPVQELIGHEVVKTPIYVALDDNEDIGTIRELKQIHGKDFNRSNYRLCTPKGTIFFF